MSIPTALVKVEILAVKDIPVGHPFGGTRYLRATFETGTAPSVVTGRSKPVPAVGGDLDTTQEGTPWQCEVRVDTASEIRITLEWGEDRGDQAPPPMESTFHAIPAPWVPGTHVLGASPALVVRVTRTFLNSTELASLARAHGAVGVSGTLAVPQGIIVDFTSIEGLYPPENEAGTRNVPGYISEDNLGRIFTNRAPDGTWAHDTQFIDVHARLTAFGGAALSPGWQLNWTIIDGDDPTNDGPEMHREWGRYIDPNDYDSAGSPDGAKGADNTPAFSAGNNDPNKLFGAAAKGTKRWAETPGGLPPTPLSMETAQTTIHVTSSTSAICSVRIHCPNVLGTNFVLKAELSLPKAIPVFPAVTGVMTMWSRIDVEVVRMAGALPIDAYLVEAPKFFLPACVQMDFHPERVVTGALDKAEMTPNEKLESPATREWINHPGVFSRRTEPGWFFLGAARRASPLPAAQPQPLVDGNDYTLGITLEGDGFAPWVEVPGDFRKANEFRKAALVIFIWDDPVHGRLKGIFGVYKVEVKPGNRRQGTPDIFRLFLEPNDVYPDFTGHDSDGSISHAVKTGVYFYPQHKYTRATDALQVGGFEVPDSGARIVVAPQGSFPTSGISPPQPNALTGAGKFFAGRTVIFTQCPSMSNNGVPTPIFADEVLQTAVHEFLHAFGMPHKCGYLNWRTPREKSCCMNYSLTWLVDPLRNPIPGTAGKTGRDMCGRHAMEVRRVHLHKNKGLNW
jgi:hypothetical protein